MQDEKEITLHNCVFVKTALMLLVILGHACSFWTGSWFTGDSAIQSRGLSFVASYIGTFHIYAFTLASGYIFAFKILRGVIEITPNLLEIRSKGY